MTKFKVGDRVVVVESRPDVNEDNYSNGDFGRVVKLAPWKEAWIETIMESGDDTGKVCTMYTYEVALVPLETTSVESDTVSIEKETSAESLRNSILEVRSKREELQKEVLQLDDQEKEALEKLKEQGFVLYEGNVSKEPVITEKKAVLYAEDIEEDMTNYENWKNGDILEVITHNDPTVPFGALVKHVDADGCWSPYTSSEHHNCWSIADCYLKFHSRPIK